jgi:hypothetical protein
MALSGLTKVVLHSAAVAVFDSSDWKLLGLRTAQLAWLRAHPRFFRALSFGDEDFDEHSLELIERVLSDEANTNAFLEFPELVAKLGEENPQALAELQAAAGRHPAWKGSGRGVWAISRGVAATFSRADWLKLGMLANCRAEVVGHDRLLRSLDFGDDDYQGHAVEMVSDIIGRQDDNYKLLATFPQFLAWLRDEYPEVAERLFPAQGPTATGLSPVAAAPPPPHPAWTAPPPTAQPVPPLAPPAALFVPAPPSAVGGPLDAFQNLLRRLEQLGAGNDGATEYHRIVEKLLTLLFEGELVDPIIEDRLHDGRKRVDITYTNRASTGFFGWLTHHYPPVQNVFIECKNYAGDPGNPAVDQLSGRFSPKRGQFGLLVCRSLGDRDQFIRRCRDTLNDNRGIVVPLDDGDLAELVGLVASEGREDAVFQVLKRRLDRLVK